MKKLLFVVIMIATWMVVIGCKTTTGSGSGCYGFWEDNFRGLKRGTISWKNVNYIKLSNPFLPLGTDVYNERYWLSPPIAKN